MRRWWRRSGHVVTVSPLLKARGRVTYLTRGPQCPDPLPYHPNLTFANMYLVRTITDEFSSPPRDNTRQVTFRVFQDRQKMDLFISGHRSRNYGTYYDHEVHDLPEGQAWFVSAGDSWEVCSCAPFIAVAPKQSCATCWHSACWGDCTHCSLCTDLTEAQQRYLKIVTELKTAEAPAQKVQLRKHLTYSI